MYYFANSRQDSGLAGLTSRGGPGNEKYWFASNAQNQTFKVPSMKISHMVKVKTEKRSKYFVARVTITASTQFMTWMYVTSSFSVAYFHFYRKQRLYIHHKNRHFLYIRQPTHDQCMMGSLCFFPCPTNSALDIPFVHSGDETFLILRLKFL